MVRTLSRLVGTTQHKLSVLITTRDSRGRVASGWQIRHSGYAKLHQNISVATCFSNLSSRTSTIIIVERKCKVTRSSQLLSMHANLDYSLQTLNTICFHISKLSNLRRYKFKNNSTLFSEQNLVTFVSKRRIKQINKACDTRETK